MTTAAIIIAGDELLLGEVADTNSAWIREELDDLGIDVALIATIGDNRRRLADLVRCISPAYDTVLVVGGLGGTHDDVTRAAVADAFQVERRFDSVLAARFEGFHHTSPFLDDWCSLPIGGEALVGASGGAPPFVIDNVFALPGVPAEMQTAFEEVRRRLIRSRPSSDASARRTWRCLCETTEDKIADALRRVSHAHPQVSIGSYQQTHDAAQVEVVVRSRSAAALASAVAECNRVLGGLSIPVRKKVNGCSPLPLDVGEISDDPIDEIGATVTASNDSENRRAVRLPAQQATHARVDGKRSTSSSPSYRRDR